MRPPRVTRCGRAGFVKREFGAILWRRFSHPTPRCFLYIWSRRKIFPPVGVMLNHPKTTLAVDPSEYGREDSPTRE